MSRPQENGEAVALSGLDPTEPPWCSANVSEGSLNTSTFQMLAWNFSPHLNSCLDFRYSVLWLVSHSSVFPLLRWHFLIFADCWSSHRPTSISHGSSVSLSFWISPPFPALHGRALGSITSVDGWPISPYPHAALRTLLTTPGASISLFSPE